MTTRSSPGRRALGRALRTPPRTGPTSPNSCGMTGMRRSTVYKYLAQLAEQGRAIQVSWGRWRAADPGDDDDE